MSFFALRATLRRLSPIGARLASTQTAPTAMQRPVSAAVARPGLFARMCSGAAEIEEVADAALTLHARARAAAARS